MKLDIPFLSARAVKSAFFQPTSIRIGGVSVVSAGMEEARRVLLTRLDARIFTKIGFLNAHCVNVASRSPDYVRALEDFIVLPDGAGVELAARLLHRRSFPANLNGTDFLPYFFAQTLQPLRVGLLGAAPGVAEKAAAALASSYPQHTFTTVSHGFFAKGAETEAVKTKLRDLCPDILLVALGVPNQELFMAEHLGDTECTLAFGVGALLDFLAGEMPRAPLVARTLRLEWLFRLALEPRRLWRRYILGNPAFIARIVGARLRRRRRTVVKWQPTETRAPDPRRP